MGESRNWFDIAWQRSTAPNLIELRSFSQELVDDSKFGSMDIAGNSSKNDMSLSVKEQCLIEGKRVFHFGGHGFNASGCRDSNSGFVVFAGSEARSTTTDAFERDSRGYANDRRRLIETEVIESRKVKHFGKSQTGYQNFEEERLVFVRDFRFSSGSRAASIVGGNLRSGECWQ